MAHRIPASGSTQPPEVLQDHPVQLPTQKNSTVDPALARIEETWSQLEEGSPLITPSRVTALKSSLGLRPLDENPLKKFVRLGFPIGLSQTDRYWQKHHKWSEVLSEGRGIRGSSSYLKKLEECRTRMGLPAAEVFLEDNLIAHFQKIEEAVDMILKELSKETSNQQELQVRIETIRDNAFEIMVNPIKKVLNYMNSPHEICMINHVKFRQRLQEVVGNETKHIALFEEILEAIPTETIEEAKIKLLKEHLDQKDLICQLAMTAQNLLNGVREDAKKEILNYWERKEIQLCFEWFIKNDNLFSKYQLLMQGKYTSISGIPRGYSDEKIDCPAYIPILASLVIACADSQQLIIRKKAFENFLLELRKIKYNCEVVTPLIFFWETLNQLLLWPKEYELSAGEWSFLKSNIYLFMGIANKNFSQKPMIPYDYLGIPGEKIESEQALLKKNVNPERKRLAYRYLYHDRIPWRALRTIGSLVHSSGGVSEMESATKEQFLRTAFVDVFKELSQVRSAIEELIDFEVGEFSAHLVPIAPTALPLGCYDNINLLGDYEKSRVILRECLEILNQTKIPLLPNGFSQPKVQYAILRTIQFLGEMIKSIRKIGILGADVVWNDLEELRDLLAHSERVSIEKRLLELQEKPENHSLFSNLISDFRVLQEFLQERSSSFLAAETWGKRLAFFNLGKTQEFFLDLPGLQKFLLFLAEKITPARKYELMATLATDSAKGLRREILAIKQDFLSDRFDPTTDRGRVEKLPISKTQKKDLCKAIGTHFNHNIPKDVIDVDGYKKIKKEQLVATLDKLTTYQDDADAEERGCILLRKIQLVGMAPTALKLALDELGVEQASQTVWLETNNTCMGKRKAAPPVESQEQQDVNELKNAFRLVGKIESRIRKLEILMQGLNASSIMKDPLLLLACQYLISDFRAAASNLELSLEYLKYSLLSANIIDIQRIQQALLFSMEKGNEILHAHDVSEPGTLTTYGKAFTVSQHVAGLIYNFSMGLHHDIQVASLFKQLQTLKLFLLHRN